MAICNDCGHVNPHATEPYVCDACLMRRAEERERAVDRLLNVEWLAEQIWRHCWANRNPRESAERIIAEAKKP